MRVKKTRKSEETRRKLPVLYTFSSSYWENICYTHTSVLHLHSQRGDEMTSLVCVKLYKGVRARESYYWSVLRGSIPSLEESRATG